MQLMNFYLHVEIPDSIIIKVYQVPICVFENIYDCSFEEYYFP